MEGVPAVEGPARPTEPASRALEYGVLGPDDTGLESSLVESADESVGVALLNEATRGSGGDGAAAEGIWGTERDPVVPTLFPKNGPVNGVGMKHLGVTPAEEEGMEFRKEGASGGEIELFNRFLALAHCDGRPLVPGAAEGATQRSRTCVSKKGGKLFLLQGPRSGECRGLRGKEGATGR